MESLRTGLIYQATNKETGKVYIGQTIQSLPFRINQHNYVARKNPQDYFHRALNKYPDNFDWSIVEDNIPIDQLDNKERYWIQKKNSFIPNGYNSTLGGQGNSILILDEKEICEAYQEGFSGIELSKYYNCSTAVIYKILEKNHIKRRLAIRKKYNDQEIIRLYQELKIINEVARQIGCSSGTVRNILQKHNIQIYIPRPENISKDFADEMKFLYENGLSCKNIGDFYGYNSEPVRLLLKSIGVQMRTDNKVTCHPVELLDGENSFYFSSVRKAAEFIINKQKSGCLDTVRRCLADVLNGKQKTAYGYTGQKIDLITYINYLLEKKEEIDNA